jgi:hypothetical protein
MKLKQGPTDYRDLDINSRINLKGLIAAWSDIAIERFQKEQTEKVYGVMGLRTTKRGVQRTMLSRNYRFGNQIRSKRTFALRSDWKNRATLGGANGGGITRVQLSFLMYGRFVDMGVGRGVDSALARYGRVRANGETLNRKPKKWYSRRKGHETHRLRELLARYYVNMPIDLIENALSASIALTI